MKVRIPLDGPDDTTIYYPKCLEFEYTPDVRVFFDRCVNSLIAACRYDREGGLAAVSWRPPRDFAYKFLYQHDGEWFEYSDDLIERLDDICAEIDELRIEAIAGYGYIEFIGIVSGGRGIVSGRLRKIEKLDAALQSGAETYTAE